VCNARTLERHLDTVHRKIEKTLKCPREGCAYATNKPDILTAHIKHVHDKVSRPKRIKKECPECGKLLAGNHMINLHLRNVHGHTEIQAKYYTYQCHKCDKVLTAKSSLLRHLIHTHGESHVIKLSPSKLNPKPRVRKKKIPKESESDEEEDDEQYETVEEAAYVT
jgi:uncharacterized C2H2 Zn-finger protein